MVRFVIFVGAQFIPYSPMRALPPRVSFDLRKEGELSYPLPFSGSRDRVFTYSGMALRRSNTFGFFSCKDLACLVLEGNEHTREVS